MVDERLVPADKKLPWFDAAVLVATHVPYVAAKCVRLPNGRQARCMARNPLYGMCYTASEALHHLSEDATRPHWVKYGPAKHQTHWYLTLPDEDNRTLDITASQFSDWDLYTLYEYGRARPFGTTYPSARAWRILERILPEIGDGQLYSRRFHHGLPNNYQEFLAKRKADDSNTKRRSRP